MKKEITISNPKTAIKIAKKEMLDKNKEHFIALYLNSRRKLIKSELISLGSLNSLIIHPREIFRTAIIKRAVYIIVLHNHPSGDVSSSREDEKVTEILEKCGSFLGIELLSHIVFHNNNFLLVD